MEAGPHDLRGRLTIIVDGGRPQQQAKDLELQELWLQLQPHQGESFWK